MRIKLVLIIGTSLLLSCANHAPPPPVIPDCRLIVVEGLEPYLYCLKSDGSGDEWRVKLKDANKYACTTSNGYTSGKSYQQTLTAWIKKTCKK